MTPEEAIARMRWRWTHPDVDLDAFIVPVGWVVHVQDAHGVKVARLFMPLGDGKWESAYAHNEQEAMEVAERLMGKRQPRRAKRQPKTMAEWYESKGFGLPMAYLANVIKDEFDPTFLRRDTFEAECVNPHCDGVVAHRHAAPWCWECSSIVPDEWMEWFFRVWCTKREKAGKALAKLIKEVF